jgi:predicted RNA-binding protein with PIN domain
MSLQYVIDGYNIIKHTLYIRLTAKKKYFNPNLADFIRLNKLCGSPNNAVTIVFDGYPPARNSIEGGMNIIYSGEKSADQKIRELIERSKNPKGIVVVTNDKEIRTFCGLFGVAVMNVEEFLGRKEKAHQKADESLKPEISYSEMHKINQELRKIWLKE